MLEFKARGHEEQFQVFFAEQHLKWDISVLKLSWLQYSALLVSLWRNRHTRTPQWHAAFILLFTLEKAIPTVLIAFRSKAYVRHRTSCLVLLRLLVIYTTDAYLSFWMDSSDKGSFAVWNLLAWVFANNWISLANWGFLQAMPNSSWLVIQTGHLGIILLRHSTSLRQMEQGLHHLTPLTGVVNAVAARVGWGFVTEDELLFWAWLLLEVFGGFVLPCWLTYKMQLRSRREWRQNSVKRQPEAPSCSSSASGAGACMPERDSGLDIRSTWALFLPEGLAFLVLSFAAGHDFRALQYMV